MNRTQLLLTYASGIVFLATAAPASSQSDATPDWSKARLTPIVDGLDGASTFSVAPDGAIWYTEVYHGNFSRFDPATGKTEVRHHVNSVGAGDERGLLGHALHPDFARNGVFFLFYTEPTTNESAGLNKIVRVENGRETVLATMTAAAEHNGGQILITEDATMFVSTGDNQQRWPAQDSKSLLGKVLRMTLDGKPVSGNLDGLVYSKGHRNVYGLAYNEETTELWATENSGWRRDEVNLIKARGNYGYPECEGRGLNGLDAPCPANKGFTPPVMSFYEDRSAAPLGATVWKGDLYWASLKDKSIHRMWKDGAVWKDEVVLRSEKPFFDLEVSADDETLLVSTWDGVSRIQFEGRAPEASTRAPQGAARSPWIGAGAALALLGAAVLLLGRERR